MLKILQRSIMFKLSRDLIRQLFNGFPSDFVDITSRLYNKTIIIFNFGEY